MATQPSTSRQASENSILDLNGRQTYLGNSFLVSTNKVTISTGSTETPLMTLTNPAANASGQPSPNPQANLSLFQNTRKVMCLTFGNQATFRFYSAPTITAAGSAITINPLRTGASYTSKMVAKLSPSTSANGTFIALLTSTVVELDSSVLFVMDPGAVLLVTAETDADSIDVCCELSWFEM